MIPDLKFDDRAFRAALKKFEANSKRSREAVLKDQARLFVQDVILITPPNKNFKANRKGGEAAVSNDIRKILRQSKAKDAVSDPSDIHTRFRDKHTGRVNKRNLKAKYRAANLSAYIKKELEKVGILASGWNAAASKLGAKVPDWISRHGNDPGNDGTQIEASAEITWSVGSQKFRFGTFPVVVEAPLTDDTPAATPNPELYPSPSEVARKSDIPTPPDLTPYALKSELPVIGTAGKLDAGTPNGAATLDETGKLTGPQVPDSVAQKSDLKPFGSNRIVIENRFSLGSLPATDANGNQITEIHVADVVHQNGFPGTPRTATIIFSDHAVTEDDVNNWRSLAFSDENENSAYVYYADFGSVDTLIPAADLANAFANSINWNGLNANATIPEDAKVVISSYTTGPLPNGWWFDGGEESYSETEGESGLPQGDYIVTGEKVFA